MCRCASISSDHCSNSRIEGLNSALAWISSGAVDEIEAAGAVALVVAEQDERTFLAVTALDDEAVKFIVHRVVACAGASECGNGAADQGLQLLEVEIGI